MLPWDYKTCKGHTIQSNVPPLKCVWVVSVSVYHSIISITVWGHISSGIGAWWSRLMSSLSFSTKFGIRIRWSANCFHGVIACLVIEALKCGVSVWFHLVTCVEWYVGLIWFSALLIRLVSQLLCNDVPVYSCTVRSVLPWTCWYSSLVNS